MATIRVLLVDDHHLVRAGICTALRDRAGIEVIAEAENGREALQLVEQHRPDVVLMDIMMPEMNGLEAVERLKKSHPKVRVIMLSVEATRPYVLKSLHSGAAGYLLKNVKPAELERAIQAVARGETYFPASISQYLAEGVLQTAGAEDPLAKLTPRQREVLKLLAEGYKSKQIAKKLKISVKTVDMHRSQLMEALDIHDVPGLVRFAIRAGLISHEK